MCADSVVFCVRVPFLEAERERTAKLGVLTSCSMQMATKTSKREAWWCETRWAIRTIKVRSLLPSLKSPLKTYLSNQYSNKHELFLYPTLSVSLSLSLPLSCFIWLAYSCCLLWFMLFRCFIQFIMCCDWLRLIIILCIYNLLVFVLSRAPVTPWANKSILLFSSLQYRSFFLFSFVGIPHFRL